jgi:hypothetical protein
MMAIMNREYPILGTVLLGNTGYIDCIEQSDVSSPVTKGYDIYRRPFFVIRALITHVSSKTTPVFQTFFQRYECGGKWIGCGGHPFLDTLGGINEYQAIFLTDLLEHKTVDLTIKNETRYTTAVKIEL